MSARTRVRRRDGGGRGWTPSFRRALDPSDCELCTFLFSSFLSSFFFPLLLSSVRLTLAGGTSRKNEGERNARERQSEIERAREGTRRNLLRRARRGGRSYFKTRRGSCLAHGARVRVGTYGDDPVDGRRYGRQMYYVRLNSMRRGRPRSPAQNEPETRRRLRDNWPRGYVLSHTTLLAGVLRLYARDLSETDVLFITHYISSPPVPLLRSRSSPVTRPCLADIFI